MRTSISALHEFDLPRLANADIAYQVVLTGVQRLAVWQTRKLQTGNLRGYMRAVFGVMVATIGSAMLLFDVVALPETVLPPRLLDYAVVALLATGAIATALLSSMLAGRSDEHTSELQYLMRISYTVFLCKK